MIGISAALISMAARTNSTKSLGSARLSNCCAAARAPRLTAMYRANTWARLSLGARALSQLSITMYRLTSARP
ncbi:hypothetical protein D3C84_931450 [compost metagenome]